MKDNKKVYEVFIEKKCSSAIKIIGVNGQKL